MVTLRASVALCLGHPGHLIPVPTDGRLELWESNHLSLGVDCTPRWGILGHEKAVFCNSFIGVFVGIAGR